MLFYVMCNIKTFQQYRLLSFLLPYFMLQMSYVLYLYTLKTTLHSIFALKIKYILKHPRGIRECLCLFRYLSPIMFAIWSWNPNFRLATFASPWKTISFSMFYIAGLLATNSFSVPLYKCLYLVLNPEGYFGLL